MTRPSARIYLPASVSSFDVVVKAASTGGLNAMNVVVSHLPASFPATTVVVQHLNPRHRSGVVLIMEEQPEGNEYAR